MSTPQGAYCHFRLNIKPIRGLSLIELLVGLSVLMIGMIGISSLLVMNSAQKKTATGTDEAATLAQSSLEYMLNTSFDDLGTGGAYGLAAGDVYNLGPVNRLGKLSSDPGATGPYLYMQHMVICGNGVSIAAGASPDQCADDPDGSKRPPELTCGVTYTPSSREKVIRILISWRDRTGKCKYIGLDALAFDWSV